ncbi:MAG TPA: hypothetical protein VFS44_00755 [Gemmatimonadaceae bacterium]|nr:hypothetical protein [Gemmatimonadaceae bacterium]
MRPVLSIVAALLLALAGARPARAQESAYRFEIAKVGDSTFTFTCPAATHGWVKPGMVGIAVDPERRDALVARFRILRVRDGNATALVTGATTRVSDRHVALLERPAPPFYRRGSFWLGTVLGAAVGALAVGH